MKIFALNPPFLPRYSKESRSPAVAKSGTLYYPMWLAYTVGYLEKAGHEVLFIDAPASGADRPAVLEQCAAFAPGMVIIDTSTPSIYSDCEVAAEVKKVTPGAFVVLVGVHVSALPQETLASEPAVDAVAVREYDETVYELAEMLAQDAPSDDLLGKVNGLAFRSRNDAEMVVENPPREFIEDLDSIPWVSKVYKKHLALEPYFYGHSRHPIVVMVTGRGCPFRCTYCVVPQTLQGHRYRKRSIDDIVGEFVYIRDNMPGVREIMIEDDTLTADKARARELAYALIAAGANRIPWSANARADVDRETMTLLHKAGCRLFCVGFESGNQQILDNIRKATDLDTIREFVRDAKRAGILIHGCFMVGNRGETSKTLLQTLAFAKELNPDTAQFYPIMVYPGTADYDYFHDKGWVVTENYRQWLTEEGLHSSVVSNPDLSYQELVGFCDRARREFYLRPRYIATKIFQVLRHPGEMRRTVRAFGTFWRYLLRPSYSVTEK